MRIKRGPVIRIRHKQVLDLAAGFRGGGSRLFRVANIQVMTALSRCCIGRRHRSSLVRRMCICRINNALHRHFKIPFYFFGHFCKQNSILLNLKMINLLIILDRKGFKKFMCLRII